MSSYSRPAPKDYKEVLTWMTHVKIIDAWFETAPRPPRVSYPWRRRGFVLKCAKCNPTRPAAPAPTLEIARAGA